MNYCVPEAIPVPCGWFLATPPPLSRLLPWLTHQHQHLGVLGPPLCPFSLACSPPSPLLYSSSCSLRRAAGLGSQCGGPSQGCSGGFALGQAGSWHPKSTQSGSGSRGGRTNPPGCPRMTLSHPTDRDPRHRGQFWTDPRHLLRASSLAKPCITPAT